MFENQINWNEPITLVEGVFDAMAVKRNAIPLLGKFVPKTLNDTIYIHELRFYKIKSAKDAMKLMCQNFGDWNKKINGLHQKNINSFIWEKVKLLDENNTLFTVVTDGAETKTDYFASIKIFDAAQKDCLKENYPYQQKLIKVLTAKMGNLKTKKVDYTIFN